MIHIIAGGTVNEVRPHLALCAPARGLVGETLYDLFRVKGEEVCLHLTWMAGGKRELRSNDDVARRLTELVSHSDAGTAIIMAAAICDYYGFIEGEGRLESRDGNQVMQLTPADKLVGSIRKQRKDLFAVGFKATYGQSQDVMYSSGLRLMKEASLNLVLANDIETQVNMVIVPEEARYHVGSREDALAGLVELVRLRRGLTYTRSDVVPGKPVPWEQAPLALRQVVAWLIVHGAYQRGPTGGTVGHFAYWIGNGALVTTVRKGDINRIGQTGMVLVDASSERVRAFGAKPSVGGQSQRIIFNDHPEHDCIVHFHSHCAVPGPSQYPYECGSHECGQNASNGLRKVGRLGVVNLVGHGPLITFRSEDEGIAEEAIEWISRNCKVREKTGGPVCVQ